MFVLPSTTMSVMGEVPPGGVLVGEVVGEPGQCVEAGAVEVGDGGGEAVLEGVVHRSGRAAGAPARRAATLPAVAPLESVSQPPETARQMEPVKSPSAWVRAAAIRAVLGTAWTQWWVSAWVAWSSSTTVSKSSWTRASWTACRTASASRDLGGTTVRPVRRQVWMSSGVVATAARATTAAMNMAA